MMAQPQPQADPELTTAASGLRLYFVMAIISVSAGLLLGILGVIMVNSREKAGIFVSGFGELVGLGVGIVMIVALARFRRVPIESGARGAATAALVLQSIVVGLASIGMVFLVIGIGSGRRRAIEDMLGAYGIAEAVGALVAIAQFFCLVVALRAVATWYRREDLRRLAATTMVIMGVTLGLVLLTLVGAMARSGPIALIFAVAALGIGIWTLVYELMLIHKVANQLSPRIYPHYGAPGGYAPPPAHAPAPAAPQPGPPAA